MMTRPGARRAGSAVGVLLLVATLSGFDAAEAGDREPAPATRFRPDTAPHSAAGDDGFYHAHLLPRLDRQFRSLAPFEAVPARPCRPNGHLVFEEASRLARRRARRGAERALKGFLLESTPVGRFVGRMELKRSNGGSDSSRATRLGLSVRHGRPVVELRRRLGGGLLRTGLSVDGRLRLEYRGDRFVRAGLRADYDRRRGEFSLACRLGF